MMAPLLCLLFLIEIIINIAAVDVDTLLRNNQVHLIGRFNKSRIDDLYQAQWPGSGISLLVQAAANSNATSVEVSVQFELANCVGSNCNYYVEGLVDGNPTDVLQISSPFYSVFIRPDGVSNGVRSSSNATKSKSQRRFAGNVVKVTTNSLPGEIHEFTLVKRTECWCGDVSGVMALGQISVDGGTIVQITSTVAPSAKTQQQQQQQQPVSFINNRYKLLFIGDSITAGFGVEGSNPCDFTGNTESVLDTYGWVLANKVNAEATIVAWSGLGVVRDFGDPDEVSRESMQTFYNRTIAVDPTSYWDPAAWQPDVITVALGTNDYSSEPSPTPEEFEGSYVAWLTEMHRDYPNAQFLLLCNPVMASTTPEYVEKQCANIESTSILASIELQMVVHYVHIPMSTADGFGCGGHPNVQTMKNMADYLLPTMEKLLGMK